MKTEKIRFKDVDGICITTEKLSLVYLPDNGGKLISIKDNSGREWLCQDENPHYIPVRPGDSYVESEVSGADEMFPTIDPCVCNGYEYPCHGEVCRVSHSFEEFEGATVMTYTSAGCGYKYTKTISENFDGGACVEYRIENLRDEEIPCLWALHAMFAAVPGGRVFAGIKEDETVEIMFDETGRLGKSGDVLKLDKQSLVSSPFVSGGEAYKYYITDKLSDGYCGYYDDKACAGIKLSYDSEKMPYLGVWMNNGGFKNMYNAAVEPCNIPYDSPVNAKNRGIEFTIPAKGVLSFKIDIDYLGK